jgi:hypothetical protein
LVIAVGYVLGERILLLAAAAFVGGENTNQ